MKRAEQFSQIEAMRGRLGLEKDDTSRDADIEKMSPERRLALIAGWHLGYSGWERTILSWVKDAGYEVLG